MALLNAYVTLCNGAEWAIMAIERIMRKPFARIGVLGAAKIADVEYRVVLNKAKMEWNVFRNGAGTEVSARKKKTSAVASAIRNAKAELATSNVDIIVTCVEGRKAETMWRGP
jgi:hypothetical protein